MALIVALAVLTTPPVFGEQGPELHIVQSCPLADGGRATLEIVSRGYKADEPFVTIDGKTERAFLDMPDDEFAGHVVLADCVHGTLIFALEYGSPYLKGVAIRKNPKTLAIERLYFSEKALPRWLYSDDSLMQVVIPNLGFETSKKYLVYKYISGKGQSNESTPMDILPEPRRKLIEIPRPRNR